MKIIFLTHDIPNPYSGATIRPFNLIKQFHDNFNHEIYIFSFISSENNEFANDLNQFSKKRLFLPLNHDTNIFKEGLKNIFSFEFISSKLKSENGVFDISYYSRKGIQPILDEFIEENEIEIIYTDAGMAGYVANSNLPKIVEPLDINYKTFLEYSRSEKGFKNKIYWFLRFFVSYYRETIVYSKFDSCVVVTEKDKNYIKKHIPNTVVIPNGVDIDYFKPMKMDNEEYSVIFTGVMDGKKNEEAVKYFYHGIYPIIRKKCSRLKFYVVGKNPSKELLKLKNDENIMITGFIEDVRPLIGKSSVYICPIISGSGIKNKVLEAMAMAKAVVSFPIGVEGIDAKNNKEIIITKNKEEFADKTLELLKDYNLRCKIGINARKLIEDKYSWKICAEKINQLLLN